MALPQILARNPELVTPATWRDTPAILGPRNVPIIFTCDEVPVIADNSIQRRRGHLQ